MKLLIVLFALCVYSAHAIKNAIQIHFQPPNPKEFECSVKDNNDVELCSFKYENGETSVFDETSACLGPYISHVDIKTEQYLTSSEDTTTSVKKSNSFRVVVGIQSPEYGKTYAIHVGNEASGLLQTPQNVVHTSAPHYPIVTGGSSGSGGSSVPHVNSPFGEPKFVFNFLSRKHNPLQGTELELKHRHVLKTHHLADFDWELIGDPGCQFVGPHVNATCTGCEAPAVPFDGPASRHHLCVLNDDDMARWHREDFLAVYEVRREQFIDAYARYEDQIEHYNRVKAVYHTAKKEWEDHNNETMLADFAEVVQHYKDKADAVYETTKEEYELLRQLQFAMTTARELYKAASQSFIDGLYDKGAAAPVFARKHLEMAFKKYALKSRKPVLQGIREILKTNGWKGKTFMLMKTMDNQIRHLLK